VYHSDRAISNDFIASWDYEISLNLTRLKAVRHSTNDTAP